MEETKERKVISRKQMSTKLLDAVFLWSIVFGLAGTVVEALIAAPIALVIKGTFYNIIITIIDLVVCAFQWSFTARIAVKLTFKRYTINKSENVEILKKTMIVFSTMYIIACILNLILKGGTLGLAFNISIFGSISFLILLDIVTTIAAIAILKYVLNSQERYIYNQCVEGYPEEKVGMSIEEKILLGILALIILYIICLIIAANDTFLFDKVDNNKYIEDQESKITEDGKSRAKSIATNVHAKNLYKEVDGKYQKATAEELQLLINEELKKELGEQYTVHVTDELEIVYTFEEKLSVIPEENTQTTIYDPKIAEVKSKVALVYAEELYDEKNDMYIKKSSSQLEQIINEELEKEFGSGYTVTIGDDYIIKYNFEVK